MGGLDIDLLAVLNSFPDAVTVHDLKGRIIWANETTLKMSGLKREEVIGELPTVFTDEREIPKILDTLKGLGKKLKKGSISHFESRTRKGTYVSLNLSLVEDSGGNPRYVVAVTRDITKLRLLREKEREVELAKATAAVERARAQEADRAKKHVQKRAAGLGKARDQYRREVEELRRLTRVLIGREKTVIRQAEEYRQLNKKLRESIKKAQAG